MRILIATVMVAVSLWAAAPAPCLAQSASHVAAAEEMMIAMDARRIYEDSREGMLRAEMAANPDLAPYEGVMRGFFHEFVSWDAVRADYIRVHVARFSEAELRELTRLYSSPIGRRLAEESAAIAIELSRVGQDKVLANQAELVRRLGAATQ